MRIGSIIYFIPFFFVLNPAFVLQGPWWESLLVTLSAGIGVIFICGGLQGYQLGLGDLRQTGRAQMALRTLLVLGGLALATPGGGIMPFGHLETLLCALALIVPAGLAVRWLARRARNETRLGSGVIAPVPLEIAKGDALPGFPPSRE